MIEWRWMISSRRSPFSRLGIQISKLAQAWDCVLLLDEADVFLAQRSRNDVSQNALVSGKRPEYTIATWNMLIICQPFFDPLSTALGFCFSRPTARDSQRYSASPPADHSQLHQGYGRRPGQSHQYRHQAQAQAQQWSNVQISSLPAGYLDMAIPAASQTQPSASTNCRPPSALQDGPEAFFMENQQQQQWATPPQGPPQGQSPPVQQVSGVPGVL